MFTQWETLYDGIHYRKDDNMYDPSTECTAVRDVRPSLPTRRRSMYISGQRRWPRALLVVDGSRLSELPQSSGLRQVLDEVSIINLNFNTRFLYKKISLFGKLMRNKIERRFKTEFENYRQSFTLRLRVLKNVVERIKDR